MTCLRTTIGCALVVGLMLSAMAPDAGATTPRTLITFTGAGDYDTLGSSVASAGDVNGDGFADLIVGANLAGRTGRAYVYFGGPGADAAADLTFTGAVAFDHFGRSVASAGDVNGDGFADLIVGAPASSVIGIHSGRAYVFYGGPGADAVADLTFTGVATIDYLGISVASAGDVNGDGFADLIVGAEAHVVSAPPPAGRANVYYGGPGADAVADLTLRGAGIGDALGLSVASAGDFNRDGFGDVIVGARGYPLNHFIGRAYLYYGGQGADPVPDLTFTGAAESDSLGFSVAGAGDVNGDGFDDVIVGAPGSIGPGGRTGQVFVYFGGPGADAVADLIFTGEATGDFFGHSVASAGDVNGDGFGDLIVGANRNDAGGANAGRAYVYYGGTCVDAVADLTLTGETEGDEFGFSVATAGDVDGDGRAEVIIGALWNSTGGIEAGRAYVIGIHAPAFEATLDINPNVINLASRAPWVTVSIEPSGFDPASIDLTSLRLAGCVPVEPNSARLRDHNANGVADLVVKFRREVLDPFLTPGVNILMVTGSLATGEDFEGREEVRIIDPRGDAVATSGATKPLPGVGH